MAHSENSAAAVNARSISQSASPDSASFSRSASGAVRWLRPVRTSCTVTSRLLADSRPSGRGAGFLFTSLPQQLQRRGIDGPAPGGPPRLLVRKVPVDLRSQVAEQRGEAPLLLTDECGHAVTDPLRQGGARA